MLRFRLPRAPFHLPAATGLFSPGAPKTPSPAPTLTNPRTRLSVIFAVAYLHPTPNSAPLHFGMDYRKHILLRVSSYTLL